MIGSCDQKARTPRLWREGKTIPNPNRIPIAVSAGLCVFLMSCGGEARLVAPSPAPTEQAIAATPSPVATPATAVSAAATPVPLGPLVWTTEVDPSTSAPRDAVTTFAPDALRIIAAVPVRGLPTGATLTASWSYNDTSLDAFATALTMTANADQSWVSFYIERSDDARWPEGVYEIVLSLDGQEIATSDVNVVENG
jgi:hypothetical protein